MTESIYLCAGSLCCSLVVCALVRLLSPSGSTGKILSVVIGVFAVCCMLSPVYDIVKSFNFSQAEDRLDLSAEEFSGICDEKVLKQTADYINLYIKNSIMSLGVTPKNIETIVSVNEERGIYVASMNIYIDKSDMDKVQEVTELISSSVGVKPSVLVE